MCILEVHNDPTRLTTDAHCTCTSIWSIQLNVLMLHEIFQKYMAFMDARMDLLLRMMDIQ
jgi:hypothetical protein